MRSFAILVLLAGSATADPIAAIIKQRAAPAMPAGLGVAKLFVPASLDKLDVDPSRVVVELPRELHAGRASIKVSVRGKPSTYVPATIARVVEVAVARRLLVTGTVIGAADLAVEERAVESIAPAAITSLVGATVTRDLAADSPIAARDVALPPPLARGSQVTVELHRGAVRVRGTATLELAARPGELATARLAHTHSIIRGTLHAPATLVVGEAP